MIISEHSYSRHDAIGAGVPGVETMSGGVNIIELLRDSSENAAELLGREHVEIYSLPYDQFCQFLDVFEQCTFKEQLTEETVQVILERGFQLAQDIPDSGGADDHERRDFLVRLERSFQVFNPPSSEDGSEAHGAKAEKTVTDRMMVAYQHISGHYGDVADSFWLELQYPERVTPETMLSVMKSVNAHPLVSSEWRMAARQLADQLFLEYDHRVLKDSLRFGQEESFYAQIKWITFLRTLMGERWDSFLHDEDVDGVVLDSFSELSTDSSQTNTLIRKFVEQVIANPTQEERYTDFVSRDEHGNQYVTYRGDVFAVDEDTGCLSQSGRAEEHNARIEKRVQYGLTEFAPGKLAALDGYSDLRAIIDLSQKDMQPYHQEMITHRSLGFLPADERDVLESTFLDFQAIAHPELRRIIEGYFDITLSDFDIQTQVWFMDFIKSKHDNEFEKAKAFTDTYGIDGLKTFINAQYGSEYGERILTIGEKVETEKAQELFHEYAQILTEAKEFARIFHEIYVEDKSFANELYEAIQRRLKDIINTAYLVSTQGSAHAQIYGRSFHVDEFDEVTDALKTYRTMLEVVTDVFAAESNGTYSVIALPHEKQTHIITYKKNDQMYQDESFTTDHFLVTDKQDKQMHFMIQTRPYGAPKGYHNEEVEYDGEARINFLLITDPENPEQVSDRITDQERRSAVTLRIDREGKEFAGEDTGFVQSDDPTKKQGRLALDIGAMPQPDVSKDANTNIGQVAAIGTIYAQEHDQYPADSRAALHHNRESISEVFGEAETFADKIVGTVKKKINDQMHAQQLPQAA